MYMNSILVPAVNKIQIWGNNYMYGSSMYVKL